jgi:hypothetical protein
MKLFFFAFDLFDEQVAGVQGGDELVVGFRERCGEFPRFLGEGVRKRRSYPRELGVELLAEKGPGEAKAGSQGGERLGIEISPEESRNGGVIEEKGRNPAGYRAEGALQILLSGALGGDTIEERGPLEPVRQALREARTGEKAVEFGVADKEAEVIDTKLSSEARNTRGPQGFSQQI